MTNDTTPPPLLVDTAGAFDLDHVVAVTPLVSHYDPKNPTTKKVVAILHYVGGQSLRTESDYDAIRKAVFGQ